VNVYVLHPNIVMGVDAYFTDILGMKLIAELRQAEPEDT
jgi:hypothetical protein